MKLSFERLISQSLDILSLMKSSRGRACLLLVVGLVILTGCNRPKERELVEVPTAVPELAALPTNTLAPTNTPAPTVPAAETSTVPTEVPTEVADEVAEAPATNEGSDENSDDDTSTDATEPVEVAFVEPQDGATGSGTFSVTMSASGVLVEPAGDVKEGSGHMHILVDTDFVPAGEVIVNDEQHLHFGNAQLDTELSLEPGEHVLRLQLADGAHVALEGDEYRDEITVTVTEPEEDAAEDDTSEENVAEEDLAEEDGSDEGASIDGTSDDASEDEAADNEATDEDAADDADDEEATDNDATDEDAADDATDEEATDEDAADEEATDEEAAESDGTDALAEGDNPIVRSPTELWVSMACSACHNINENQTEDNIGQPGPHQNNLYERAGERVEGQSAEEYVYNSIVNTNDFIVEPYVANVMPQNFGESMSDEEIQGLVDWLLDPNRESLP